jgi:hypothetical protein
LQVLQAQVAQALAAQPAPGPAAAQQQQQAPAAVEALLLQPSSKAAATGVLVQELPAVASSEPYKLPLLDEMD